MHLINFSFCTRKKDDPFLRLDTNFLFVPEKIDLFMHLEKICTRKKDDPFLYLDNIFSP